MRELDLVGKKFNKLTSLEKIKIRGRCHYRCLCECGGTKTVEGWKLSSGYAKSCGCAVREADSRRSISKRIEKGLANARKVINYYKRNARRRGIVFELLEIDALQLFKQSCYYCNRPPFNIIKSKNYYGDFIYNGIDRRDNKIGYILDNCVSCCKNCNIMKNTLTQEEFLHIISLIYLNTKHEEL